MQAEQGLSQHRWKPALMSKSQMAALPQMCRLKLSPLMLQHAQCLPR